MTTGAAEPPADKTPRTERGRRTLRKLLDAAAVEFGERGFHDASITAITGRAGTALGTFYTYFASKEEIFRAVMADLSGGVRDAAREAIVVEGDAFDKERAALSGFLNFVAQHKEIYRIIDEAEFVDPQSFRTHYETTARRIYERLLAGVSDGELREDITEAHAWAIMGMNVFLGLRYVVWGQDLGTEQVADVAGGILRSGIARD